MLDGLLNPGHFRSQAVVTCLHLVKLIAGIGVGHPQFFNTGIDLALFGDNTFQFDIQLANFMFGGANALVVIPPLQGL